MTQYLDFRSDTVTQATPAMRRAMAEAEVGDDILGEDPTVRRLEETSASLFGMEAGLFVVSGTMANQVAIMAMTRLGDEVLVGAEAHIYNLEVGGLAALSGVQVRPLRSEQGRFQPEEVLRSIRSRGVQSPVSRVLCLENTYDLNRGLPLPPAYIAAMAELAHEREMQVYLDGARIFNAAAALGVALTDLAAGVDALQFCLTKGLAAPFGSVLLGSREFIDRARWVKQRIGGGMRQAGHMAAAGLVALDGMRSRLPEDHRHARRLAQGLAKLHPGLANPAEVLTNIVQVNFAAVGMSAADGAEALLRRGIKVKPIGPAACRMITHWGIGEAEVAAALEAIAAAIAR